jgi:hypothetical protein
VIPLIETALQELQGLFLDNPSCTKEGSQEDVHPERAGSSCGDRFANLVGNSRSGSAFDVVFLSPEHRTIQLSMCHTRIEAVRLLQ